MASKSRKNILIGCSGSVASIKIPEIAAELGKFANIKIIPTKNALYFLNSVLYSDTESRIPTLLYSLTDVAKNKETTTCLSNLCVNCTKIEVNCFECKIKTAFPQIEFVCDTDEWNWKKRGDVVAHIVLKDWADIMLISPLSANTLAKIANGLCPDLLTSVIRAWDHSKPVLFALAMNTQMYNNPPTKEHRKILTEKYGFEEIEVVSKTLICGDTGEGAMAEISTIVDRIKLLIDKTEHK